MPQPVLSGCTWLTQVEGGQCFSCDLTRTRPNDEDACGIANFPAAERAKRHVIFELDTLGFPVVSKHVDPENGLAFDLLSGVEKNVVIGHAHGLITIDLAESEAARRMTVRENLGEPYRTMLGHFRHEVGHYHEWQLVRDDVLLKGVPRAVRGRLDGLPGRDRPALLRGPADRLGVVVHLELRDRTPTRTLPRRGFATMNG